MRGEGEFAVEVKKGIDLVTEVDKEAQAKIPLFIGIMTVCSPKSSGQLR